MSKPFITFILALVIGFTVKSQTLRYFEFKVSCGYGNWQDTSFIAATSNPAVISSVLADLDLPYNQRRFINGKIDNGNDGYNHNAGHWFLWHFIPDNLQLAEMAVELCDGCPYSAVDADTAYWISNVGYFCPWGGKPAREISSPVGIIEPDLNTAVLVYPNPVSGTLNLKRNSRGNISVTVYNSRGLELTTLLLSKQTEIIDISDFPDGLYFLKIADSNRTGLKKVVVRNK